MLKLLLANLDKKEKCTVTFEDWVEIGKDVAFNKELEYLMTHDWKNERVILLTPDAIQKSSRERHYDDMTLRFIEMEFGLIEIKKETYYEDRDVEQEFPLRRTVINDLSEESIYDYVDKHFEEIKQQEGYEDAPYFDYIYSVQNNCYFQKSDLRVLGSEIQLDEDKKTVKLTSTYFNVLPYLIASRLTTEQTVLPISFLVGGNNFVGTTVSFENRLDTSSMTRLSFSDFQIPETKTLTLEDILTIFKKLVEENKEIATYTFDIDTKEQLNHFIANTYIH